MTNFDKIKIREFYNETQSTIRQTARHFGISLTEANDAIKDADKLMRAEFYSVSGKKIENDEK